ncbi:E3 ubiquitin-protein ligase TRIM21 isoform X1 [Danio rerio]|uniref:E3 ubiquitin-protein ligase TRIM39 n=3 Tax=Danio rerio TaxID=7955 RepID=A0A8M3B0Z3_DANRE|nr:E3 ubiquitin-protein ligase TRIM39-like [Danio rerio]|eukprot:XP_009301252.1 E3 ubiquitin-protein ligase TRIM39-like [Danio rerio]
MSSSSSVLFEELHCSVCRNVFTDPVSTPCGHNFCKSCLNTSWENSQNCICPLCTETFSKRHKLKTNTTLRDIVKLFDERYSLRISGVLCDICDGRKMKAMKSCLTCQTSFCETHLEPHRRVPNFKKHKLMEPVKNMKEYICQKHDTPLELFCRDDQMCVCVFCTDGDHKTHHTVPLEEESKEKKIQMIKTQKDLQSMIEDRIGKIQDIKHSAEHRKKNTAREKVSCVELFSDLLRSLERCQAELLKIIEEKQKAAEKQEEELIQELQQEITELKMRNTELDHLSSTEDHLQLLQIYPSICSPPNSRNWSEISINTDVSVEMLRTALTQLQETLDKKLSEAVLRRMQQYAVDVTLDPDTAHPCLILSNDGKQVKDGEINPNIPNNAERFDEFVCVLGKEGFSSGKFYFEVEVKGKTEWDLGVAKGSVNRKGRIIMSPQDGFWTVALRKKNKYWACPCVPLSLRLKPQTVGVFVDYEEGLVSFYDVESRSHMYSFTGQSLFFQSEQLHPFFSPCLYEEGKYSAPLIISPVNFS